MKNRSVLITNKIIMHYNVKVEGNVNNIYSRKCKSDSDGILYYELDKSFSTNGTSGGPIVNEKGEVVGIHIGSDGNGLYVGNSATSFSNMIKKSFK